MKIECQDNVKLRRRQKLADLLKVVPFYPGRAAIGFPAPLIERHTAIVGPAAVGISEFDPAPADGKVLQQGPGLDPGSLHGKIDQRSLRIDSRVVIRQPVERAEILEQAEADVVQS